MNEEGRPRATERSTPMARRRILIAGAGIGGLAAAIALRQRGFDVAVFERAPELGEVGAGVSVWPNATHVLDELGVLGAVRQRAWPMREVAVRTERGATLFRFQPPTSGPPSLVVHRADLHDALVAALPRDIIQLGTTVTGFVQDEREVTLRLGDAGETVGDVLIGADGLNSVVRGVLHGRESPIYRGYAIWRGIIDDLYAGHSEGMGSETLGHGLRFGLFGTGANRSYWYACENAPEDVPDDSGGTAGRLRRLFGEWPEPVATVVARVHERAVLRNDAYDRRPLRRWGCGRTTLLGDAAHPTTPNLGQGACLALEDALVLARCLAADPLRMPEALVRYERARRRRTAAIVRQSRLLGAIGQWHNPVAVAIRNAFGGLTPDKLASGALRLTLRYRA